MVWLPMFNWDDPSVNLHWAKFPFLILGKAVSPFLFVVIDNIKAIDLTDYFIQNRAAKVLLSGKQRLFVSQTAIKVIKKPTQKWGSLSEKLVSFFRLGLS